MTYSLNRGTRAGGFTYKTKEPKFAVKLKGFKSIKNPYEKPLKTKNALTELEKLRR
jgi:hypothetical protein